jgi:hypothetical protein
MIWLLIGYMWLFIHRPFEVWPTLGEYRLEFAYMLVTLVAWVFSPGKRWLGNGLHTALFAFAGAVLLCWTLSPWMMHERAQVEVQDYLKVLVFYVLLVTTVREEKDVRLIIRAFVAILALYMLHSLWEYHNGRYVYRMDVGRMVGVDKTMSDPNTFGATVIYGLPFGSLLWICSTSRRERVFAGGYIVMAYLCVILTGSRGAMLGLLLWTLTLVMQSRWRWRLLGAALLLSPLIWFVLPEDLQLRYETIVNPAVGPENAEASTEGRLLGLLNGLALWGRYPLSGCGPGAWLPATGSDIESHQLIGQIIGEMGTLGVLTFGALVLTLFYNVRAIRAACRANPQPPPDFLYYMAGAVGMSLVLLLFEGMGGHNLYRYNWLWYSAFLVCARYAVQQRSAEAA